VKTLLVAVDNGMLLVIDIWASEGQLQNLWKPLTTDLFSSGSGRGTEIAVNRG